MSETGAQATGGYPPLHAPARPEWSCLACAEPWPCRTRRGQLRELFQDNLPALVSYLIKYLTEAVAELDHLGTAEIMERFVGWCARPPDTPETTCPAERVDRHRPPNLGPVLRRLPSRRSL